MAAQDAIRLQREAAEIAERDGAARNRRALQDAITDGLEPELAGRWLEDADLASVASNTTDYTLSVRFPGHWPILASFRRSGGYWGRHDWMRGSVAAGRWRIANARINPQHVLTLGEALALAEQTADDLAWLARQQDDADMPF